MKPTNAEETGCSPISSNCVIWQGQDLPCIKLCKGDTVSIVIAKLAAELCSLIDTFKLENYDLACLNLGDCPPEDFQELIQLLIERICALEGVDPASPTTATGCPDCVVNIAECFYFNNELGDQETTMQLTDYVTAIGNRLCAIVEAVDTINETLAAYNNRLKALEEAPAPTLELPQLTPVCVLEGTAAMDEVLIALEAQFCTLITATGESSELYTAINAACAGLTANGRLSGSGAMSSIQGWVNEPSNLAESFMNMWLTVCDMRASIKNIQATCCPTACDGVDVVLTAVLTDPNTLTLYYTGSVPVGYTECNPAGSTVTITDTSGGTMQITVPVIANLNNALGYGVSLLATPINGAEDLTIITDLCVTDGSTQCQSVLQYVLTNTVNCPTLNLTPGLDSILYQFGWVAGAASFVIELYDSTGTVLLQSHATSLPGPGSVNNTFVGLSSATLYKVRVIVTVGQTVSNCPLNSTTTLSAPCVPPTGVVASPITIP